MPIYEYKCPECGVIEVIQKFNDRPLTTCPNCASKGHKNKVSRLVSAAAFHLKGSGWYKTDYSGKSTGNAPIESTNGNGHKNGSGPEKKDASTQSSSSGGSTSDGKEK